MEIDGEFTLVDEGIKQTIQEKSTLTKVEIDKLMIDGHTKWSFMKGVSVKEQKKEVREARTTLMEKVERVKEEFQLKIDDKQEDQDKQ